MDYKDRSFAIAFSSALLIFLMATFSHGAWVKNYPDKDRPMEENLDYMQANNTFLQDLGKKLLAVNKLGVWYDGWDNATVNDNVTLLGPFPSWDNATERNAIPKREGALSYDRANDELYSCNGTSWKQVATGSAPVAATIPVGTIFEYGGVTAPEGYLMADGSAVSRSTYSELFTVYSTTYGVGDGSTTFNLPDRRGRVAVGKETAATLINTGTAGSYTATVLGATGGDDTDTLNEWTIPSHTHSGSSAAGGAHTHTFASQPYIASATLLTNAFASGSLTGVTNIFSLNLSSLTTATSATHTHSITVGSTGGGYAHNNVQPYITMNYIIKY